MGDRDPKKHHANERKVLNEIACMGFDLPKATIDWAQIGKNAVHLAQETLAGKCDCCGRRNEFKLPKKTQS